MKDELEREQALSNDEPNAQLNDPSSGLESEAFDVFEAGLKELDEEDIQQDGLDTDKETEGEEPEVESDSEEEDSIDYGDDKEAEEESDAAADEDDEGEEEEIPEDQVTAARMLGLKDEQIVSLAENSPEVLETMARNYRRDRLERTQDEPPARPEPPKEPELLEHTEMDLNEMDPEMAKVMSQFLSAHNKLIDKHNFLLKETSKIGVLSKEISARNAEDFCRSIDKIFDGLSENLPEVGDSRHLDESNKQLRSELYAHATVLQNIRGMNIPDSIEEAAFMWKMAQVDLDELEKKATNNLKRKLKKNVKRMSPRPGGRKTQPRDQSPREEAQDTLAKGMDELLT